MNAKIGLEDVRFHAPHGFYEEEHRAGNEFSIDVEVESNIHSAATQDDLGGTVNYSTIYYLLQAEMKKLPPTLLLEALAFRMANRIQNQFPQVTSVKLRLRKLNPPLGGHVGAAVVEVNLGGGGGGGGMSGLSGMGGGMGAASTFDEDAYGGSGFGGGGGSYVPGPFAGGKPTPTFLPQEEEDDYEDDEDFEDEDENFELDFDAIADELEGDFEEGGEGYDLDGDYEDDGEGYYDDDYED